MVISHLSFKKDSQMESLLRLVSVSEQMCNFATYNSFFGGERFTTGEMRNSSSSYHGRNILVKESLFMEVRLVCAVNITLIAPSMAAVTTLIFMCSSGPRPEGERGSVPEQVTKGGDKGWSCD